MTAYPPSNMTPEQGFVFAVRGIATLCGASEIRHDPNSSPNRMSRRGSGELHFFADDPEPGIENHGPGAFRLDHLHGAVCCVASGIPGFWAGERMARALLAGLNVAIVLTRPATHVAWTNALLDAGAEIIAHIVDDEFDTATLPGPVADAAHYHEDRGRA